MLFRKKKSSTYSAYVGPDDRADMMDALSRPSDVRIPGGLTEMVILEFKCEPRPYNPPMPNLYERARMDIIAVSVGLRRRRQKWGWLRESNTSLYARIKRQRKKLLQQGWIDPSNGMW